MATTFAAFKRTNLYRAMQSCGHYDDEEGIEAAFDDMRLMIEEGADPEEVLHDEGFEPDYIYDLL